MKCPKCNLDVVDCVLCKQCNGGLHYQCAGVAETTYRKMSAEKKDAWRCPSCRASCSGQDSPTLADLLRELKDFRREFSTMQSEIASLSSTVADMSNNWNEFNTRFEQMEERLVAVELSTKKFASLQKELDAAKITIAEISEENNKRDQYSRLANVEISGIPVKPNENLNNILHGIYSKVGLTYVDSEIISVHRVRRFIEKNEQSSRQPAIIVRFVRLQCKDRLLAAVRARRGLNTADIGLAGAAANVYINDHLTPANKLLLKKARELKLNNGYAYLWVRDCKILMRKSDTAKIMHIASVNDLGKIK